MAHFDAAQTDLASETGDPAILEKTIDIILREGFIEPLQKQEEPDALRREQLLRRKIILEGIFIDFVSQKKWEHAHLFVRAHDLYMDTLHAKTAELGYLSILNFIMSEKIDSAEQLIRALR